MKLLIASLLLAAFAFTSLTSFAATETATTSTPYGYGEDKVQKITWSDMNGGDTGSAIKVANWTKKSVTFTGTWNSASATLQGSNDGTTYYVLSNEQGVAVSATANSMQTVGTNPLYIRPVMTGATSGSIVIDLILAK